MPEFVRRARKIMEDDERAELINFMALNPTSGLSLGGGLRKVRFARQGGGKSGGYRVIYVFGGDNMPIFLLTVFAKNEKANLTKSEQAQAVDLARTLVKLYGGEHE
ncbi:type II toxin-antitoxin system RelE/ParE family toxin [Aristophania vespae]|uniref:type II toxin-antitoxin system RelE/ParE family toxin n=1 Tax=Aristophania vespae TaxID=2697033 RepID=UPI0023512AF0|nr:type II toxin-antitoxin system RelE/ParE family toxin [Aristophania vespae]